MSFLNFLVSLLQRREILFKDIIFIIANFPSARLPVQSMMQPFELAGPTIAFIPLKFLREIVK
jgi:hypothetical protein